MKHVPVLLAEVIENLNLKNDSQVVDCTLGDAGHSEKILEKIPAGKLIGIDTDIEAILRAKRFLYNFADQIIFIHNNFVNLKEILKKNNFIPQAILMDLGWSTPQFKERKRGFSFAGNESLDMRYDEGNITLKTASEILRDFSEEELEKIFKEYGEENFATDIAKKIVTTRKISAIQTTNELVEIVLSVYKEKLHSTKDIPWIGGIHPATKVFQALRIAVNQELEILKKVLPDATEVLAPGGRLAIITFHSLEDRIVKHFFQKIDNKNGKIITKKPITASAKELKENLSARSAKLRIFEKHS